MDRIRLIDSWTGSDLCSWPNPPPLGPGQQVSHNGTLYRVTEVELSPGNPVGKVFVIEDRLEAKATCEAYVGNIGNGNRHIQPKKGC